jgi:hypothetical protein
LTLGASVRLGYEIPHVKDHNGTDSVFVIP